MFNNTASTEGILSASDVLETMEMAAANTSAGGLSFDPDSIIVTSMVTLSIFDPMIKVTALEHHANNKYLVAQVCHFSLIPALMHA